MLYSIGATIYVRAESEDEAFHLVVEEVSRLPTDDGAILCVNLYPDELKEEDSE